MEVNIIPLVNLAEQPLKTKDQVNNKFEFLKEILQLKNIIRSDDDIPNSIIKDLVYNSSIEVIKEGEEICTLNYNQVNNSNSIILDINEPIEFYIILSGSVGIYECDLNKSAFDIKLLNNRESISPQRKLNKYDLFGTVKQNYLNDIIIEGLDDEDKLDDENMNKNDCSYKIISLENNTRLLKFTRDISIIKLKVNTESSVVNKENPINKKINALPKDKNIMIDSENDYVKLKIRKTEYISDSFNDFTCFNNILNNIEIILKESNYSSYEDLLIQKELKFIKAQRNNVNIKLSKLYALQILSSIDDKETINLDEEMYYSFLGEIKKFNKFVDIKDKKELMYFYLSKLIALVLCNLKNNLIIKINKIKEKILLKNSQNPNYFIGTLKEGVVNIEFKEYFYLNSSHIISNFDQKLKLKKENEKSIENNRKLIKEEDLKFEKSVYCLKCQIHPRNVIGNCNHLLYCDDCMKNIDSCGKCGQSIIEYLKLYRC